MSLERASNGQLRACLERGQIRAGQPGLIAVAGADDIVELVAPPVADAPIEAEGEQESVESCWSDDLEDAE